ncbi:class II aldolase/adducin family protein [Reichenbachiella ulvae]|uniref:Class II aldolase/adducin family protein n=1 Tax=Reichenbachiella ulvae TaxID=2980104 RepID=A0ABT3CSY8_9BACT|nr:class II aldolase/adducin family protein [Reichenbachiella ulvae]MCV9386629.1 class II aldolase/adducin family protein [Reichenbachiella ulvae]
MRLELLHPRNRIALIMELIYKNGMTTTSGGNISILDEEGNIWITPAGYDKGILTAKDIVCVRENGRVEGMHRPSSEFPFHAAIYRKRPDVKAVIHAHPPALVSFSIVRKVPDTNIIPQTKKFCGHVGYAPYQLPGSDELGESIANTFSTGSNAVIMENHGTVVGGSNLFEAFQRFECLEFSARSIINSQKLGGYKTLTDEQIISFENQDVNLPEADETVYHTDEKEIRHEICTYVKRACEQNLMISSHGSVSMRWRDNDFLITPTSLNRRFIGHSDIVQIKGGTREKGKYPSKAVKLHQAIYEQNPDIKCIINTQPPATMAFGISHSVFQTRTIPESYILLKDIPFIEFGDHLNGNETIPKLISKDTPIAIIKNDSIVVTGGNMLETFDRLEVAEFSAQSLIESTLLGDLVAIGQEEIDDLVEKFLK